MAQLGLQLAELLLQVLLILGPQRTGLDFSRRLLGFVLAFHHISIRQQDSSRLTIVNKGREAVVEMVVIV